MFISICPHYDRVTRTVAIACLALVIWLALVPIASARSPYIYGFGDPDDEKMPDPDGIASSGPGYRDAGPWRLNALLPLFVRAYFFSGYCVVCSR